jgi:hypothetical protein
MAAGITYIKDNSAETIAGGLVDVIEQRRYEQRAEQAVEVYGSAAVSKSLNALLDQVTSAQQTMKASA